MARRSCDFCVRRKIKCDSGLPCQRCVDAKPPLRCTYLKPVLKRGPKTSKLTQRLPNPHPAPSNSPAEDAARQAGPEARRLPASLFAPILEAYRCKMYPVWPVVDAVGLQTRLEDADRGNMVPGSEFYALVTALSAATMAQLSLGPLPHTAYDMDKAFMEKECQRLRDQTDYREHPTIEAVLVSFFLHVYHAKAHHRNSAMIFLQEAIALARLLELDIPGTEAQDPTYNTHLIFPLLWVSERGYAIQHGLRVSVPETISLAHIPQENFDLYGKGLLELTRLFSMFDLSLGHSRVVRGQPDISQEKQLLVSVHDTLVDDSPRTEGYDLVQKTDYLITKRWMQILLWQQAMRNGFLSSQSEVDILTFLFPSRIAHDILSFISTISHSDLEPLGRDQFVKLFEVTNTLADVILCAAATSIPIDPTLFSDISSPSHRSKTKRCHGSLTRECCRYGPPDFLHGLFQVMSPFLDHDAGLREILRQKAADVLLQAPSRMILCSGMDGHTVSGDQREDEEATAEKTDSQHNDTVTTWAF